MAKTAADGLKKIKTSFLKKHRYFCGYRGGLITWTSNWSGDKSSVGIEVSTLDDEDYYLRIHYTQTDNYSGEKKNFNYKIPLTTTPCRYGGKRHWFVCPWYKNGTYCGKRVGVLYKNGDHFACRHCYDLTYESRNVSGIAKAFGRIISAPEMDEAREQIKRFYYGGKMTKKYRRYLHKEERFLGAWDASMRLIAAKYKG